MIKVTLHSADLPWIAAMPHCNFITVEMVQESHAAFEQAVTGHVI